MPDSIFLPPIDDRYFEDYSAGRTYEFGPTRLDQSDILAFARQFDPQTMHIDMERSADGPYAGLIASGWHTASAMMRLYVDYYLSAIASLASPGVDELRWHLPVRPDDELRLRVSVETTRLSRTKPDRGLVVSLLRAINQRNETVCSMRAMNLFLKRK